LCGAELIIIATRNRERSAKVYLLYRKLLYSSERHSTEYNMQKSQEQPNKNTI